MKDMCKDWNTTFMIASGLSQFTIFEIRFCITFSCHWWKIDLEKVSYCSFVLTVLYMLFVTLKNVNFSIDLWNTLASSNLTFFFFGVISLKHVQEDCCLPSIIVNKVSCKQRLKA